MPERLLPVGARLAGTILALCLITGCAPDDAGPDEAARSGDRPEITAAALRNATYPSQHVAEGTVRLTDGTFEDTARRVIVSLQPEYAAGDLDGDGSPDAAVVLATTTGGSGTFLDLIAVLNDGGQVRGAASRFLGDRVPVERVRIVDGVIELDLTMHGPADPMCCPTLAVTRRFRLAEDTLEELEPPPGTPDYEP